MKNIKEIAGKILNLSSEEKVSEGIYATLEDLIEQRRYINFVNYHNKKTTFSKSAGDIKSAFKGRGMEFDQIRSYQYGDEVRDIDWRVTARKMTPYTKIYNEERNRDVYVFLDLSPSMVFGTKRELKSVAAAKIAGLLGWISFENKDKFGCLIYDGSEYFFYKPQNSRAALLAVLKKMSEIGKSAALDKKMSKEDSGGFEKSLRMLQKNIKSRAEIFLISDFYMFDDKVKKSLAALSKKGKLYLIDVFDRIEKSAPRSGEYMISDGDKNLIFDTGNDNFKDEYAKYFVHKSKLIKDFCLKFSFDYMSVSTAIPIFRQIKLG
ncbi:MAG: DUF58 domain-containing protein [Lactobacillaceae bacterium]|jgi:uncharacterized protein (DUF58 family)|nr:DUF58 domain-containing protein [Lactobacillaceae bacterium]